MTLWIFVGLISTVALWFAWRPSKLIQDDVDEWADLVAQENHEMGLTICAWAGTQRFPDLILLSDGTAWRFIAWGWESYPYARRQISASDTLSKDLNRYRTQIQNGLLGGIQAPESVFQKLAIEANHREHAEPYINSRSI